MAVVRSSPLAEADLDAILDQLDRTNPEAARRYAVAFREKSEALARFPEMGRPRPEIAPDLRSTLVNPYVLFYRAQGDEVQILRILHGRRDLRRIMREESGQ